MIEHHIQKKILRQLVLGHDRFSELNPAGVDSNLYNYHLHQLIAGHYVEKTDDNRYHLTELGKAEGINIKLNEQERLAQAHSILLLNVRDTNGRYVLRRRTAYPMYGKVGFVHGEPQASEPLATTAARIFQERTGLTGDFSVRGSGFVRIFLDGQLESFTNYTLLSATIDPAELITLKDETGENYWTDTNSPDLSHPDMVPSTADLAALCEANQDRHFFSDNSYFLDS